MATQLPVPPDAATSFRMRRVGVSNTPIERRVRSVLHRMGYRFGRKSAALPGRPDIVLPRHRTAVFVHGCFWHGHTRCRKGRLRPQRNAAFWNSRLERNAARDRRCRRLLQRQGWRVLIIWECQLEKPATLEKAIRRFFDQ